jgi:hypothetical protein
MEVANTLAYHNTVTITAVKSIIVKAQVLFILSVMVRVIRLSVIILNHHAEKGCSE